MLRGISANNTVTSLALMILLTQHRLQQIYQSLKNRYTCHKSKLIVFMIPAVFIALHARSVKK